MMDFEKEFCLNYLKDFYSKIYCETDFFDNNLIYGFFNRVSII